MPKVPTKARQITCHHCRLSITKEHIRMTHRFVGQRVDSELNFCSGDCLREHFWDGGIRDEINREVSTEKNWLYKQVCPACRNRIISNSC